MHTTYCNYNKEDGYTMLNKFQKTLIVALSAGMTVSMGVTQSSAQNLSNPNDTKPTVTSTTSGNNTDNTGNSNSSDSDNKNAEKPDNKPTPDSKGIAVDLKVVDSSGNPTSGTIDYTKDSAMSHDFVVDITAGDKVKNGAKFDITIDNGNNSINFTPVNIVKDKKMKTASDNLAVLKNSEGKEIGTISRATHNGDVKLTVEFNNIEGASDRTVTYSSSYEINTSSDNPEAQPLTISYGTSKKDTGISIVGRTEEKQDYTVYRSSLKPEAIDYDNNKVYIYSESIIPGHDAQSKAVITYSYNGEKDKPNEQTITLDETTGSSIANMPPREIQVLRGKVKSPGNEQKLKAGEDYSIDKVGDNSFKITISDLQSPDNYFLVRVPLIGDMKQDATNYWEIHQVLQHPGWDEAKESDPKLSYNVPNYKNFKFDNSGTDNNPQPSNNNSSNSSSPSTTSSSSSTHPIFDDGTFTRTSTANPYDNFWNRQQGKPHDNPNVLNNPNGTLTRQRDSNGSSSITTSTTSTTPNNDFVSRSSYHPQLRTSPGGMSYSVEDGGWVDPEGNIIDPETGKVIGKSKASQNKDKKPVNGAKVNTGGSTIERASLIVSIFR